MRRSQHWKRASVPFRGTLALFYATLPPRGILCSRGGIHWELDSADWHSFSKTAPDIERCPPREDGPVLRG